MNKPLIIILVLVSLAFINACNTPESGSETLKMANEDSPYSDLNTPGVIAEVFDSNKLLKKDRELSATFSIDENEFYFTPSYHSPFLPQVIVFRKDEDNYNSWNKYDFYAVDPGNDSILYCKNKYIERTDSGWSKVKSLGAEFERKDWFIMSSSVSKKGTLVFDDFKSGDVIRQSSLKDGRRQKPELLGEEINEGQWTAHPFIAPDESYLMWDSEREEGFGGSDLYLSFKMEDGSWGKAINLGKNVNSEIHESGARVSADGKYLFFSRSEEKLNEDGSTYWEISRQWVDATIIENLRGAF